jgi:hypothetical protein
MYLLSHEQAKEHLFRKKHAFAAMAIIIRAMCGQFLLRNI